MPLKFAVTMLEKIEDSASSGHMVQNNVCIAGISHYLFFFFEFYSYVFSCFM